MLNLLSLLDTKSKLFGVRYLQFTKQLTLKLIYYNVLHNKAIMWVRSFLCLIRLLIFLTAIDYFTSRPYYYTVRKDMLYIKQLHPEICYYSMLVIFGRPNARSLHGPPSLRVQSAPKILSRFFPVLSSSYSCQSFPVQSSSVLSCSVVSCPKLLFAILSCPVLPCHISILSGPVPTVPLFSYNLFLFCLVLLVTVSCHALSSPFRLSLVLSC
jgi:hypothetical protein